jgi:hypothetical protein
VTGGGLNRWRTDHLKPGQFVVCTILKEINGGYNVTVDKEELPGFLASVREHSVGSQLKVAFVCVDKGRLLLTERFSFESDPERGSDPKFPLLPIDSAPSEPETDDFI